MGRKATPATRQIGWRIDARLLDALAKRIDAAALDRRRIAESIIAWWLVEGADQQARLNVMRETWLSAQAEAAVRAGTVMQTVNQVRDAALPTKPQEVPKVRRVKGR